MEYAVLDTETTGLLDDPDTRVVEVGVAVFDSDGDLDEPVRTWSSFCNPDILTLEGLRIARDICGITEQQIRTAPPPHEVELALSYAVDDLPVYCWNTAFDMGMVRRSFYDEDEGQDGIDWSGDVMLEFGKLFRPVLGRGRYGSVRWVKLQRAARMIDLSFPGGEQDHRVIGDCIMTGRIRQRMLRNLVGPPKENPKGLQGKLKFELF